MLNKIYYSILVYKYISYINIYSILMFDLIIFNYQSNMGWNENRILVAKVDCKGMKIAFREKKTWE